MWARGRFDISWSDLAWGLLRCAWPGDAGRLQRGVERLWSPAGDAIACYSVRSGFDLLLRSLALPAGSEVLFSALNVRGMTKVVERLGLVPVPVDLDLDQLAPRPDRLERAISDRSRVLVVAHLFGARIDLGPVFQLAARRGLFVVEDCAQAFEGLGDTGDPRADASLFSFGPLKTATALGGALARIRDPELRERMRSAQAGHPVQTRGAYLSRLVRFSGLKLLTYRASSAALFRLTSLTRVDLDRGLELAARSLTREKGRSHPGRPSQKLARRPSAPMLALLEHRLRGAPERRIEARRRAGQQLLDGLEGAVVCPGARNPRHSHWLFPVLAKDPAGWIGALRAEGFDAAPIASLRVVPAPDGRPDLDPVVAREFLAQVVFVPCYAAMGERALAREASLLRHASGAKAAEIEPAPRSLALRFAQTRRRWVKAFGKRLIRRLADFQGRQSLVGNPGFFDARTFPAAQALEANWRAIRAEIDTVLVDFERLPALAELSPDQKRIAPDERWRAFVFYGFGFRADRNLARCPETARLLAGIPGLESAWLSIHAPAFHVPAHAGITKGLINCLLGLRVPGPPGACRIRVGDEIRAFAEGKTLIIDDTITHEVWNDAAEPRVVLLMSFRRPMRRAGRLLNTAFLALFKQTGYVHEAVAHYRDWEARFYPDREGSA
ncbi:MAG TPA: aspartyl/asparaginyl beta-hydroxylase domain-containing protein [Myxococcota bacterium]|jgi:dTDP-4-amino-4,6-dideoxygalactose transaminase